MGKESSKKWHKKMGSITIAVLLSVCFIIQPVLTVQAGWVDRNSEEYKILYGNPLPEEETTEEEIEIEVPEPNAIDKVAGSGIVIIAATLYLWMRDWNIDMSIEGIVYGRMAGNRDGTAIAADFTHFGLEPNNPYGIFGAAIYYNMRGICLQLFPVVLLIMLIMQLFHNSSKGRAQLKEMLENTVVIVVMLFALPYVLDFVIFLRDVLLYVMANGVTQVLQSMGLAAEGSWGTAMIMEFYVSYMESPSFIKALLFAAAVGAGFFFLASYVVMASLLAAAFGFFPLVAIYSYWNRRVLQDWISLVIPNLLIPLFDAMLLMFPSIINAVYYQAFGDYNGAVTLFIVILIIIWNTVKIRDTIVRLLGFTGLTSQRGMGMAFLASMALRSLLFGGMKAAGAAVGKSGAAAAETASSAREGMETAMKREALMNQADRDTILPPIESRSPDRRWESQTDALLQRQNEEELLSAGGLQNAMPDADNFGPGRDMPLEADAFTGEEMPPEFGLQTEDLGAPPEAEALAPDVSLSESGRMLEPLPEEGYQDGVQDIGAQEVPYKNLEEIPGGGGMNAENASQMPGGGTDAPNDFIRMSAEDFMEPPKTGYWGAPDGLKAEPVLNDQFMQGLPEREKLRYRNLAQKDAYMQKVRENEEYMASAGYHKNTYEQDREALMARINGEGGLNHHINRLRDAYNGMPDKNSEAAGVIKRELQANLHAKAEGTARIRALDEAASRDRRNAAYAKRIERCSAIEKQYAKNSAIGGMSNRWYETAKDYEYQRKLDDIKRRQMDYKNFDSRAYEGILSPGEKAEYYRERERKQMEQRIAAAAVKAGSAAVGVMAGAAAGSLAAYGGPMAMLGAGLVAGKAVSSGMSSGIGAVIRDTNETAAVREPHVQKEHRAGSVSAAAGSVDLEREIRIRAKMGERMRMQDASLKKEVYERAMAEEQRFKRQNPAAHADGLKK